MSVLLRFLSYLFHPIFIPLMGTALYFIVSPRNFTLPLIKGVLLQIVILSICIPFVFFFLLKNMGLIRSIFLRDVQERKIPVLANMILMLMIIYRVIPSVFSPPLFYFFVGIIITMSITYLFILFRFKASMHMMGIGGLVVFLIGLSLHYQINISLMIACFVLASGAVATSRLYLRAHTKTELVIGLLIGTIPQLATFIFWL
ncbi:hypothetical protein ACFQ1M_02640 [Sungkyunkwania multivorans]|uniref:Transmembrane protein n=1 Tax=Sungkyunkwania multivorans TaxID=1173618 RepID=A0ABW3CWV8_9FLAO